MMIDPIDVHIGSRLRRTREFRGLSQTDLARSLGLSVETLKRLERGATRLSAKVMLAAARRLDVNASFFLRGLKGLESVARDGVEAGRAFHRDNVYFFPPRRPSLASVGATPPKL